MHVLLERLGLGGAHHPLDRAHGERRVGGDLAGQLARRVRELGVGHDVVDETELERLLGEQRATGEGDLGGLRVADDPRQQPRAAALGEDAALGEPGCELGGLARRRGCRSRARGRGRSRPRRRSARRSSACRGCAARSAARRAGRTRPGSRRGCRGCRGCRSRSSAAHLGGQVEPGAERAAGAGEHDAAHLAVAIGLDEQLATGAPSIGPEIVFIRSGAFSVMVAMWSLTSYSTSSARCVGLAVSTWPHGTP